MGTLRSIILWNKRSSPLPETLLRLGPFDSRINKNLKVKLDGKIIKSKVTKSGDSTWIRIKIPTGLKSFKVTVISEILN